MYIAVNKAIGQILLTNRYRLHCSCVYVCLCEGVLSLLHIRLNCTVYKIHIKHYKQIYGIFGKTCLDKYIINYV